MVVLFEPSQIQNRIAKLGSEIDDFYKTKVDESQPLLLLGILDGCVVFTADLIRNLTIPVELSFLRAKSYQGVNSGKLTLQTSFLPELQNRQILIVEDILDSGKTITRVMELLNQKNPAAIHLCCLLHRRFHPNRNSLIQPHWLGFTIEDEFVVGFGMDYKGKLRNLPYIGIWEDEISNSGNI